MENIKSLTVDLSNYSSELDKLKKKTEDVEEATEDFDNTLAGLNKKLKDLKSAQLKVDIDSKQFVEYANQISVVESKIKDIKQIGKDSFNSIAEEQAKARIAANNYGNTMDELKKKLKDLNTVKGKIDIGSNEFKKVSDEILNVNTKLKDLEASQGVFSRNVGNYANSFIDAYGKMGKSAQSLVSQVKGVSEATKGLGSQLKSLAKNPYLAALALALTAILGIVGSIKKAISSNEETTRKWKEATAKLQPLFDAISNTVEAIGTFLVNSIVPVIETIADWVNTLTLGFYDLAEAIGKTFNIEEMQKWAKESKKAYEDNIARQKQLVELENQLTDLKRRNVTEIASLEAKAAELREKATDTETYNAKERKKYLEEEHNLEQQALLLKKQEVELEVRIAESRAEATSNSKEDNDALAEKKKLLIEIEKEISQNNSSFNREVKKNLQEQKKEFEEYKNKQIQSLNYDKQIYSAKKSLFAENSKLYKFYLKQELEAEYEKSKKEIELSKASQKQKQELISLLNKQYRKQSVQIEMDFQKKNADNIIKSYENALKVTDNNTENFFKLSKNKLLKEYEAATDDLNAIWQNIFGKSDNFDKMKDFGHQIGEFIRLAFEDAVASGNGLPIQIENVIDKMKELASKLFDNYDEGSYSDFYNQIKYLLENVENIFGVTVDDIGASLAILKKDFDINEQDLKLLQAAKSIDEFKQKIYDLDETIKDSTSDVYDRNLQLATLTKDIAQQEYENIVANGKLIEETTEQFEQRKYEARIKYADAANAYEDALYEAQLIKLQEQDKYLNSDDPSLHYDEELTALHQHLIEMQAELEAMQQKEYESREAFEKRKQKLQKKYNKLALKEEKLTWNKRLSTINQGLSSMSTIFGAIADLYAADAQADSDASEEKKKAAQDSFETMKSWKRAGAIVDMLSGALGITMAYLKEETFQPAWIRPALAAAQYAATLMSGMATIRQINATTFDSSGSEGSGSNTVESSPVSFSNVATNPLLDETVDTMNAPTINTSNVNNDEQDNRVYILQSDIEESNKQVKVRQTTTTF